MLTHTSGGNIQGPETGIDCQWIRQCRDTLVADFIPRHVQVGQGVIGLQLRFKANAVVSASSNKQDIKINGGMRQKCEIKKIKNNSE